MPMFQRTNKLEATIVSESSVCGEKPNQTHIEHVAQKECVCVIVKETMKIREANAAVDKEWENVRSCCSGTSRKKTPKAEVVRQANNEGRAVHFALPSETL